MSNKKRKLSPTLSSRSSSTPAPSSIPNHLANSSLSAIPLSAASPTPDGLSVPGHSRQGSISTGATPAPSAPIFTERTSARPGTVVIGSGDGTACGDECFLWTDLPMNKGGYRYAACGPSPRISPHPSVPFYRNVGPPESSPPVHLSWLDRSAVLRLSINALTASVDRGFRSARANVSVREGSWYYEVYIERGAGAIGGSGGTGGDIGNPHVRLGWGRREALLDAPVGLDGYSYGIRDVAGEKIHLSRPKAYGRPFGTGDVIGCLIELPPRPNLEYSLNDPARLKRKRVPLRWKGQMYFESEEYAPAKEMEAKVDREGKLAKAAQEAARANALGQVDEEKPSGAKTKGKKGATTKNVKKDKDKNNPDHGDQTRIPTTLPNSSISFFLNGESLGTAFTDLYDFPPLPALQVPSIMKKGEPIKEVLHDDGTMGYYPMISCFGRSKIRCNFGPEWMKPPEGLKARPMCDRWSEFREEERIQDEKDEEELSDLLTKQMKEEEKRRELAAARLAAATQGRKAAKSKILKKKKGSETPRSGTPAASTPVPESSMNESSPNLSNTPKRDDNSPYKFSNGSPVKYEVDSRAGSPLSRSSPGGMLDGLGGEGHDEGIEHEAGASDEEKVVWV